MIGFPDFILDPKELDDVYDGVRCQMHNLLSSVLLFSALKQRITFLGPKKMASAEMSHLRFLNSNN